VCYRSVSLLNFNFSLSDILTKYLCFSCITSGTEAMFTDLGYYKQAPVRVGALNKY
jgi:hypothetical protein